MATKNYTYPHVSIKSKALKRSSAAPAAEDTTILFAPILADRGPTDKVVVCHTLSDFIDVFGDLNYTENRLQAFNVYNWLSNGGTVYAKRLKKPTDGTAKLEKGSTEVFIAKHSGEWYKDIRIKFVSTSITGTYNIFIEYNTDKTVSTLESYYRVKADAIPSILLKSDYINVGKDFATTMITNEGYYSTESEANKGIYVFKLTYTAVDNQSNNNPITLDGLVGTYFTGEDGAAKDLGNRLETPIDVILDAGFSATTKNAIFKFVTGLNMSDTGKGPTEDAVRPDIIAIFEEFIDNSSETASFSNATATNIAVYTQHFTIYDAIFSDTNTTVGPTYFLSKLIPSNDLQYGVQFPTAGLRRGILADALAVNNNPGPDEKQQFFDNRINYVEKTSREYAFMSQRTHDGSTEAEYTALSFLNNSRCLEKMKKELERIGRDYLFEFNDSVTLSQLSNILNKYMGNWVANRTLNYAEVEVHQDEYSTEKVNIFLNIRFTGTIEIISVDITIE